MEKLDVKSEGLLGKVKKQPLWIKVLLGLVALLLAKEILLTLMVKNIFNEFHQFHQDFQREQRVFDERFDKAVNDFEAKFQAFKTQQEDKMQVTEHFIEEKQTLMSQPLNPEAGKSQNGSGTLLIFVSFSMPKESLVALVRDAKKIHASVVLCGLVDNSFKKTLPLIADIVKEAGGGGLEINPLAFSTYHVEQVPTIIAQRDTGKRHFDAVSGDVPLIYALKTLSEKGEVANEIAKNAYLVLKERQHV